MKIVIEFNHGLWFVAFQDGATIYPTTPKHSREEALARAAQLLGARGPIIPQTWAESVGGKVSEEVPS